MKRQWPVAAATTTRPWLSSGRRHGCRHLRRLGVLCISRDVSQEIMNLHHDKHHLSYVNGANAALEKLENGRRNNFQGIDVKAIERDLSFHYAGHMLHSILWPNMKSGGGVKLGVALADKIN